MITLKPFWDYVNELKINAASNSQFEKIRLLLESNDFFQDIKMTDCLKNLLKK